MCLKIGCCLIGFMLCSHCFGQVSLEEERKRVARIDELVSQNKCDEAMPILKEWEATIDSSKASEYFNYYYVQSTITTCYFKQDKHLLAIRIYKKLMKYTRSKPELYETAMNELVNLINFCIRMEHLTELKFFLDESVFFAEYLSLNKEMLLIQSGYVFYYSTKIAKSYDEVLVDKLVSHLKQKLYLLSKLGKAKEEARSLYTLSKILLMQKKFESALNYINQAAQLIQKEESLILEFFNEIHLLQARIYAELGNNTKANEIYEMIKESDEQVAFFTLFEIEYNQLYDELESENLDDFMSAANELLKISEKQNYTLGLSLLYHLKALKYKNEKQYEMAKRNIIDAYKLIIILNNENNKRGYILQTYSEIAIAIGIKDTIFESFVKDTEQVFIKHDKRDNLGKLYVLYSNYYNCLNDTKSSRFYRELATNLYAYQTPQNIEIDRLIANKLLITESLIVDGEYELAQYNLDTIKRYEKHIPKERKVQYEIFYNTLQFFITHKKYGDEVAADFLLEKIFDANDTSMISTFLVLIGATIKSYYQPEKIKNAFFHYFNLADNNRLSLELKTMIPVFEDICKASFKEIDTNVENSTNVESIMDTSSVSIANRLILEWNDCINKIFDYYDANNENEIRIDLFNDQQIKKKFSAEINKLANISEEIASLANESHQNNFLSDRIEIIENNRIYYNTIKAFSIFKDDRDRLLSAIENTRNDDVLAENISIRDVQNKLDSNELIVLIETNNRLIIFLAISKINSSLIVDDLSNLNSRIGELINERYYESEHMAIRGVKPTKQSLNNVNNYSQLNIYKNESQELFYKYLSQIKSKLINSGQSAEELEEINQLMYRLFLGNVLFGHENITSIKWCVNGYLSQFPFESVKDFLGRNAIEVFEMSYIPNISVLLNDNENLHKTNNNLIVGVSDFTAFESKYLIPCESQNLSSIGLRKKVALQIERNEFLNCFYTNHTYSSLNGTLTEVREIEKLLPNSKILYNSNATEGNIKALFDESNQYNVIHIATHGVFNTKVPELSSVILNTDNTNDGYFSLLEIEQSKINANLVVLSACETSLGYVYTGGGNLGLPQAFLKAGAKNVLATLWKVDDEATKVFMVDFYQKMKDNNSIARALQLTKTDFINGKFGEEYTSPYYWSGFVLTSK